MSLPPCGRITAIEKDIDSYPPEQAENVRWMIEQIRGWQLFAKRVIDYGEVLKTEDATITMKTKYEELFSNSNGKDTAR